MPPRSASSTQVIDAPLAATEEVHFVRDIGPDIYRDREYYAARDACNDRNGILHALRSSLRAANGRKVRVAITVS